MSQITLTDLEYSNRKKKTKREEFLDSMDEIIPWFCWVDMIHPYYFNFRRPSEAKKAGIIPEITPVLEEIKKNSFYVSEAVEQMVLREAEEV